VGEAPRTILPDLKISAVVFGSRMRIITAANRCDAQAPASAALCLHTSHSRAGMKQGALCGFTLRQTSFPVVSRSKPFKASVVRAYPQCFSRPTVA